MMNARDLGGYPADGGVTRYGVFIRSEVPKLLSKGDMEYFKKMDLRTVLDFRSHGEAVLTHDVLADCGWLSYHEMPMFDPAAAAGGLKNMEPPKWEVGFTWGMQYVEMSERHKDWVRDVMHLLAVCEGAALYHCTTGKDRTGIVSALLLSVCGVRDEDIIADYCVSQVYLREMYRYMAQFAPEGKTEPDLEDAFFSTSPKNMETLLDAIHERYGSAEEYLRSCGVGDADIAAIRAKLIERV